MARWMTCVVVRSSSCSASTALFTGDALYLIPVAILAALLAGEALLSRALMRRVVRRAGRRPGDRRRDQPDPRDAVHPRRRHRHRRHAGGPRRDHPARPAQGPSRPRHRRAAGRGQRRPGRRLHHPRRHRPLRGRPLPGRRGARRDRGRGRAAGRDGAGRGRDDPRDPQRLLAAGDGRPGRAGRRPLRQPGRDAPPALRPGPASSRAAAGVDALAQAAQAVARAHARRAPASVGAGR